MRSINCTISPSGKENESATVLLEGDLILGNTQKIIRELTMAVNCYSRLQVEVKNVTDIDLAGVQLLFAFSKAASARNAAFSIQLQLPGEAKTILSHAGFENLTTLLTSTHSYNK